MMEQMTRGLVFATKIRVNQKIIGYEGNDSLDGGGGVI